MTRAKIAITIEQGTLSKIDQLIANSVYKNRSQLIQESVNSILMKIEKTRLAQELSKISIEEEQALAEEGIEGDFSEWPEY